MQKFSFHRVLITASLALAFLTSPFGKIQADEYTLAWVGSGFYRDTGAHAASNFNYLTGFIGVAFPEQTGFYNNYTVFDLSGVSGVVVSAELRLFNPDGGFQGDPQTLNLFDVNTSIPDLQASHTNATGIYSDLGTGTLIGSRVGPYPQDDIIVTPFNAAGLIYIQSALGNLIAFGGRFQATGQNTSEIGNYLFGGSGSPEDVRVLHIITRNDVVVPAPAGLVLAGFGLAGVSGFSYVRRRKFVAV